MNVNGEIKGSKWRLRQKPGWPDWCYHAAPVGHDRRDKVMDGSLLLLDMLLIYISSYMFNTDNSVNSVYEYISMLPRLFCDGSIKTVNLELSVL